ncbi:MAG TPA: RHS repeat-associated core domain-containing protein, partial [Polyangia bacterium]
TIPRIGLVNMNGRIYDPLIGRFLSPDPTVQFVANLQSFNRYTYVLNNPLRYTDPTGYSLNVWNYLGDAFAVVGAVVGCVYAPEACGLFIGAAMAVINTQSAIASGEPWGQAVAIGIISFSLSGVLSGVGEGLGGAAAGGLGMTGMAAGMTSAAVSGAFSGAVSTAASDEMLTGGLGWNVLEEAAVGAAIAAFSYGISHNTANVTKASAAQGGETVDSVLAAAGVTGRQISSGEALLDADTADLFRATGVNPPQASDVAAVAMVPGTMVYPGMAGYAVPKATGVLFIGGNASFSLWWGGGISAGLAVDNNGGWGVLIAPSASIGPSVGATLGPTIQWYPRLTSVGQLAGSGVAFDIDAGPITLQLPASIQSGASTNLSVGMGAAGGTRVSFGAMVGSKLEYSYAFMPWGNR